MSILSFLSRKPKPMSPKDNQEALQDAFRDQLIQQVLSGGFKSPGKQRRHRYANMTISEIRYCERREER